MQSQAQSSDTLSFFEPSPTFSKQRFWIVAGTGTVMYTGAMIGLNELWYKQYPRGRFQFFNDWKEWNQMDKAGHLFTGYFESLWAYKGARWTGMSESDAIWVGSGIGLLLQTSVEVLDGFSSNWGFSVPDMAFNVLGTGAFFTQQKVWGEQRIAFKVSGTKRQYSTEPILSVNGEFSTTLEMRADDLFGSTIFETFLKDYNAQTVWASVNISSFLKSESQFPKWLNIAFGYGSENMFGGFGNRWSENDVRYLLESSAFPRYRQYYISPDIDFTRIPTRKPFVKTLLTMLNIFKFPAPALEFNGEDGMKFHLLHY